MPSKTLTSFVAPDPQAGHFTSDSLATHYSSFAAVLAEQPDDHRRHQACEASAGAHLDFAQKSEGSVLWAYLLIAHNIQHGYFLTDPEVVDKAGSKRKNLTAYVTRFLQRRGRGHTRSQVSRAIRGGQLALQILGKGLPLPLSPDPLIHLIPLKSAALASWQQLVQTAGGVAPSAAEAKAYYESHRGTTNQRPRSKAVLLTAQNVQKICTQVITLLQAPAPDIEAAVAELQRLSDLHKLKQTAVVPAEKPANKTRDQEPDASEDDSGVEAASLVPNSIPAESATVSPTWIPSGPMVLEAPIESVQIGRVRVERAVLADGDGTQYHEVRLTMTQFSFECRQALLQRLKVLKAAGARWGWDTTVRCHNPGDSTGVNWLQAETEAAARTLYLETITWAEAVPAFKP